MLTATVLAGLAILVGLIGIIVPLLPGTLLIVIAVAAWAAVAGESLGWVVFGLCAAAAVAGWVLQYLVPGRRMRAAGVPTRTTLVGVALGVVGFFLIPVLGLVIGFVAGVYLAELARLGSASAARPSTRQAVKAAALSYGIELAAGLAMALIWLGGAIRLLATSPG